MGRYKRIVFLDRENTYLSPLAETMARCKLKDMDTEPPKVASRGNVVLFPEPVNSKIEELARAHGHSVEGHRAIKLSAADIAEDTLVLALDLESRLSAQKSFADATNVFVLKEYIGESGDIEPPVGGTMEEYDAVCARLEETLDKLVNKIREEGI